MKRLIYKVEQIDYMGYPSYEKFFRNKSKAKHDFERRLQYIKKFEDAVDPEEDDDETDTLLLGDKNKIKTVTIWYWKKTSYEYEEYDRYPIELNLREIELY